MNFSALFHVPSDAMGEEFAALIKDALENSPSAAGERTVGPGVEYKDRTITYVGVEDVNRTDFVKGFLVLEVAAREGDWRTITEVPVAPFYGATGKIMFRQCFGCPGTGNLVHPA